MTSHDEANIISIIIVTYNSKKELPECLESIKKQTVPCEVFIVDNASTDGTQELIKKTCEKWPKMGVILNTENRGLAYGNNQPLHMCTGDYVLFLNPDTALKPNTIELLVSYLEIHPSVGVIGPKSYFEDGNPHVSFHYSWTIFQILLWRIGPYGLIRDFVDRHSKYQESDVLFISGACLLIRKDLLLKIGGYDQHFFLTVEDVVDLCLRIREEGYRVVFYPSAELTHLGSRSYISKPYIAMFYSYQGSLYFLRKYKGAFWATFVRVCYFLGTILKASLSYTIYLISRNKSQNYKRISEDNFRLARILLGKQFQI